MATPISEGVVAWPDEFVARYVEAGYWEGLPLGAHLLAAADRSPDAVAVVDGETRLSYAELVDRADAAASRLTEELGIGVGERIVLQLPNSWEFVVLTLACLRAGIVPVMALPAHRRTEIAHLAEVSEAVAIAVPDRLREFDHQTMAHEIEGPSTVLCAGEAVAPGSEDLREALRAVRRPGRGPRPLGRRGPRRPRRRPLPALRRHHGPAQAHPAHPRRLRLQRQGQRRGLRDRRRHRLPHEPAGRPQLPARLPRDPRHAAARWPGRAARHAPSRSRRSA